MDSPLLSYIDIRHANFLPPQLIVGEARDLGPWYTASEEFTLVRDSSAKLVSENHRVHVLVELKALVQVVQPAAAE